MDVNINGLGIVRLKPNQRAKRLIVRYRDGVLVATHPLRMKQSNIEDFLTEMKPEILKLREKSNKQIHFTPATSLQTATFRVVIKESNLGNYYFQLENLVLCVTCPMQTNFEDVEVQSRIRAIVIATMKKEAKRILPLKLSEIASKFGFVYKDLKINSSKGRWGSCSSQKNINLSYYCLLLPDHLINFVILHELCHTLEMNHGDKFWKHLDRVSNSKAKELTQELKTYSTQIL